MIGNCFSGVYVVQSKVAYQLSEFLEIFLDIWVLALKKILFVMHGWETPHWNCSHLFRH